MRKTYRITPVYTGDVSGAAAALFELGGMVVIHDPSGCNSTYNTHDETRWYDNDSLIYLSGLNEIDSITGNDEKLIEDILLAAEQVSPKFIALVNSPIPYLIGMDMEAACRIVEKRSGIPAFYIQTNAMHDYVAGAGLAYEQLAKRFILPSKKKTKRSVNILGMTPLDFVNEESVSSIKNILKESGWEINSVWSMGCTLEDIHKSASAELNLVVSAAGLPAAKYMYKEYGISWIAGIPCSTFRGTLLREMEKAISGEQYDRVPYVNKYAETRSDASPDAGKKKIRIIGEAVTMGSLAASLREKFQVDADIICPLENSEELCACDANLVKGEEGVEEALRDADVVIADPLYRVLCRRKEFIELPHLAFSGRIFLKNIPDLMEWIPEFNLTERR